MAAQFKRIVIIAPTRSTCVNIHTMLTGGEIPPTLLMQERRSDLENLISSLDKGGFGVVAGTGTGKTAAFRNICQKVVGPELLIDIVTREHEATYYTWTCNVLVVTPGVALNWLKDMKIGPDDLIGIDEIHQTSEHLELAMALAKRAGCKFIWMSATIDPKVYQKYLAENFIKCTAFDPNRKAKVEYYSKSTDLAAFIRNQTDKIIRERRGIAIFVPTRADAEGFAKELSGIEGLHVDFYHGGENAEKLRAFLTGDVPRPFAIFMTIAGASSLNIQGLDTVIIIDEWYTEMIRSGGVKSLEKQPLGPNELLQMGGRVNGRAVNGRIHILTDRRFDFHELKPVAPKFVLGGDLERVALTCAKIGVDARELDLIGEIDRNAYARVVERFKQRVLLTRDAVPRLTDLGGRVERLPVEPSRGEILDEAMNKGNRGLLNITIAFSCVDQLFKLVRRDWDRGCDLVVQGSDHLTAYNIVAAALRKFGYVDDGPDGAAYRFRGDWVSGTGDTKTVGEFIAWCDNYGFAVREIKNVVLAMKSVYRQLKMILPEPAANYPAVAKDSSLYTKFVDLIAKVQSLDFVRGHYNSFAGKVWTNSESVSNAFQTLGSIRFFTDKKGHRRASMEGTEIPDELLKKYASREIEALVGMSHDGERIIVRQAARFAGEPIDNFPAEELSVEEIPESRQKDLPRLFAEWLARGNVEGTALEEVVRANSSRIKKFRELNSRAGENIFKTYDEPQGLCRFYLDHLGGARCVSEINDLDALLVPYPDGAEVVRITRENPENIEVGGEMLAVEYTDYYGRAYAPRVKLTKAMIEPNKWRDLPDDGIFLPSGRQVEVVASFDAYNSFAATDMLQLKERVRKYLNQKQWESWVRSICPFDLERLEDGEGPFPGIITAEYGRDVIDDKVALRAHGAVCLKRRFSSHNPIFAFEWYRDEELAEDTRESARRQFVILEAVAGDRRELEDAQIAAEKSQNELREYLLICEDYLDLLNGELRARFFNLRDIDIYDLSFDDLQAFTEQCQAAIVEIDAAV